MTVFGGIDEIPDSNGGLAYTEGCIWRLAAVRE
jgi:hypothetical protein